MPVDLDQYIETHRHEMIRGVSYLSAPGSCVANEELYLQLRELEHRVYSDPVVRTLPRVDAKDPHRAEWRVRDRSTRRLIRYLESRPGPVTLLDVGCGNGWMANRLARIPHVRVYALDTNRLELEQAARVFADNPRVTFMFGDLFEGILPRDVFDVVVLAAAAQYFGDLRPLIERLFELLSGRGEVHIIDSPFYDERDRPAARERSRQHFAGLGVPGFAAHYHHHLLVTARELGGELLYDPRHPLQRFRRRLVSRDLSPFPWLRFDQVSRPGS